MSSRSAAKASQASIEAGYFCGRDHPGPCPKGKKTSLGFKVDEHPRWNLWKIWQSCHHVQERGTVVNTPGLNDGGIRSR